MEYFLEIIELVLSDKILIEILNLEIFNVFLKYKQFKKLSQI